MSNNNYDDERPEIHLNRKMRMWNKYRKYCFILAAILVIGVVGTIVASNMGKSEKDPSHLAENKSEAPTKFVFPEEYMSEKQTSSSSEKESGQSQSTNQSESQSQTQAPTTAAPTGNGNAYMVSGQATPVELNSVAINYFKDAAIIGDSLVEGFAHYHMMDESKVFYDNNVTSDRMSALADKAVAANVNKIFILVGLNDANYGTRSAADIAKNISSVVDYIKAKDASANVYVLSILPVQKSFEDKPNIAINQKLLNETNQNLKSQAENKTMKASYIDIATAYKDATGYLLGAASRNGFSIVPEYYPFMVNGIAEVLK